MAAASQPIALPLSSIDLDCAMGSYNGGSFNPASYTKHFIGTPISWKAGSFGGRFYHGGSPGQLRGPLDTGDFKCAKISSSIESDRGSFGNPFHGFDRQDELCRNYSCCGQTLTDMHALVDHCEEVHIVPLHAYAQSHLPYPDSSTVAIPTLPSPVATPEPHPSSSQSSYFPSGQVLDTHPLPTSEPIQASSYSGGLLDPDDMEFDSEPPLCSTAASSVGSCSSPYTPPETPIHPFSHPIHPFPHYPSQPPSPRRSHAGSRAMTPESGGAAYPFNTYAGYSDYSSSMPGTVPRSPSHDDVGINASGDESGSTGSCVHPSAVFPPHSAATTSRTQPPTRNTSRSSSPCSSARISTPRRQSTISAPSTTLSRPASTLLLSKPFRCPKSNCNKSYKQANGLKYHITHGSCSLKPVREVEAVKTLLASKSAASAQSKSIPASPTTPGSPYEATEYVDGVEVTQADLLLIEKRIRPFACGIGDCQRRYKNMNGLRYHYSHSGHHGRKGLEMLAMGVHECLGGGTGNAKSRSQSRVGSRAQSRAQTPPLPPTPASAGMYEGFESCVTSPSPVPQAQTPHLQRFAYQGMTYQTSPHQGAATVSATTFAPFQTTSYTLAGAMGPMRVPGVAM